LTIRRLREGLSVVVAFVVSSGVEEDVQVPEGK
jgi:hypothetical protein